MLWSSMVSAVMHLLSSEEDGPSGSRTVALISGWDGDGERELSVPEVSLVGHRPDLMSYKVQAADLDTKI